MVLMTDGLHNTGREPILSAREAAAANITIHTVTFSSDADIPRMRAVADGDGRAAFSCSRRGGAGADFPRDRFDAAGDADGVSGFRLSAAAVGQGQA